MADGSATADNALAVARDDVEEVVDQRGREQGRLQAQGFERRMHHVVVVVVHLDALGTD